MKLLIVAQKVDAADANLGFFVGWIRKLAERAEVTVIANEIHQDAAGYVPNDRIQLYSLGKEKDASPLSRLLRYQRLLWKHLRTTDGVFFHMCPEYVLGAHLFPRIFHKRTLLWYVHKEVSWRLRFAALFVDKIFTASKESCRLRSKKVETVGHGIDTETQMHAEVGADSRRYQTRQYEEPLGLRLVTAGRIAPVKDLQTLILGFLELKNKFPEAMFSVLGAPITGGDRAYLEELKRLTGAVRFRGGVPPADLPPLYGAQDAFVHASKTGSMDKAVLEALAAGLHVFTSSEAFSEQIPGVTKFREGDSRDLAEKIASVFERGEIGYNEKGREWVAQHHNLHMLVIRIVDFFRI